ncbi:hypothetical protein [Sorangium cellulosum]|uniref:Uncharacterized protein n=1 Tax=Sorangium cellulosum TaxID=56 RepID=A0A150QGU0_SORCE|nr:hypothetical protein [Sorangium cellulosum]KYF67179.1 hypothetical protein BE15_34670 [Sorangium cellulosum]
MSAPRSCSERMAERRETCPAQQPKTAVDDEELERERDENDDKLIDLPPLGHDEEEERDEGFEELLQTLDDAEGGLDDVNASDLEVGVELAEDEDGVGEDEAAEEGVDVGALHEGIADADAGSWLSDEAAGHEDDDNDDLDAHGGAHGDDGGAEGTGEDPSDDVDEGELPALDADQDGAYEGEDLLAELPDLADDQAPVWDALPWVVVEGAGAAVPCSTLAAAGGYVVAGGAGPEPGTSEPAARSGGRARRADRTGGDRGTVLVVDAGALAARRAGVDASASSIALSDAALLIATRRGNLLLSDDRGKTASPLGAWGSGGAPVTLAMTPGRLWVLSGKTLWSPAAGAVVVPPETGSAVTPGSARREAAPAPARGALSLSLGPALRDGVLRMSASEGVIVALTSTEAGPQLERLRGDDEGSPAVPLSGAARRAAEADDGRLAAASGGRSVALSGAGLLCVSRDGGETFRVIEGLPLVVALAFAGDHRGSALLALVAREGERRAQLVHVPSNAAPTLIAEIEATPHGAAEDDAAGMPRAAIAWDASREVVWVACSAGLLALTRQRKH